MIRDVRTRVITVPLARPWGADVTTMTVIAVAVDTDSGTGHGFSWTPTIGASAVDALLRDDIRRYVIGRDEHPESLWDDLWAHLHEAGGGGITTIAMAGVDLALWDLAATTAGLPVAALLGSPRDSSVEVYGSGVNLHYSLEELCRQAERWVAAGFDAVKLKVGSPGLVDDITRVGAVRDIIGPDRRLMVDANQRWDLEQAIDAIGELQRFDLAWVEEPLRADDLLAHRQLRTAVDVPIAVGENLHTSHRFAEFIDAGVVDVAQPNAVRVGGITPFLRIANAAAAAGIAVAPHLLFELSGQLATVLPGTTLVEAVEDASFLELGLLDGAPPVSHTGATLVTRLTAGLGIRFADAHDHRP